jgi:hypothetical protein
VGSAALAAGVAAGAILWMRAQAPLEAPRPTLLTVRVDTPVPPPPAKHAARPAGGGSYVVPTPASSPRPLIVPGTELANYIVAHFEVSSPVAGHAMLSALVAGDGGTGTATVGSEEQSPVEDVQDDAKTLE